MPVAADPRLSLKEFHSRYGAEKPYFEYWDGEAVQKCSPNLLHSRTQMTLVQLLGGLGYEAGLEITLKLHPDYEPIPDVIGVEGQIRDPYPTEPFEVVIEVVLPEDTFSRVMRKCRLYEDWGIRQVIIVDPEERLAWSFKNRSLRKADVIARRGDRVITAQQRWAEVDRLRHPAPPQ